MKARRLGAADIHAWLLRWFNPNPTLLGATAEDRERFYALTRYPEEREEGEIELASGTDFAQRLFFGQPRSDVPNGLWFFDGMPHRVIVMDRLRTPPVTGHLTGETRKGGDATLQAVDADSLTSRVSWVRGHLSVPHLISASGRRQSQRSQRHRV